jgi:GDP-L-fucose synthase
VDLGSKIYIAGHRGLVGSALFRSLQEKGYRKLITRTHAELDLEEQTAVDSFFFKERPQYVLLAAAKVGGIHANASYPVDFLLRNLKIEANVIEASWRYAVEGLLFLGSSCIYPRLASQPLKEEFVLTGSLELTNEPYAIAKIAGIELCEAFNRQFGTRFLSVMPTNLYGLNDNYDLETSHVLPAFIRKFHLAKLATQGDWNTLKADEEMFGPIPPDFYGALVNTREPVRSHTEIFLSSASSKRGTPIAKLWGTGSPRREFLFADDLADACVFLMNRLDLLFSDKYDVLEAQHSWAARHLINIGYGEDHTVSELAELVAEIVGFHGPVQWDSTKPDGTPRKLMDVSRITNLGWRPKTLLEDGIRLAYQDYLHKGKS